MLWATTADLTSCKRDLMVHRVKNIYYLDLHRERVPTPAVLCLTLSSHHLIQEVRAVNPQLLKLWGQRANLRHHNVTIRHPMSKEQMLKEIPFPRDTSPEKATHSLTWCLLWPTVQFHQTLNQIWDAVWVHGRIYIDQPREPSEGTQNLVLWIAVSKLGSAFKASRRFLNI